MLRIQKEPPRRHVFHDPAFMEQRHAGGQFANRGQVVRDQEDGP